MWDLGCVLFDSCKNAVFGQMLVFVNVLGFPGVNWAQIGSKPSFFDMSNFRFNT